MELMHSTNALVIVKCYVVTGCVCLAFNLFTLGVVAATLQCTSFLTLEVLSLQCYCDVLNCTFICGNRNISY